MNRNRLLVAALAALMTLSVLAPAGAVATQEDGSEDDLTISVAQDDGIVVTVESNGTAVANATVGVSVADENDTYAGTGTYTTDENGTVTLDAPTGNESVEVSIEASADGASAETTVTLDPVEEDGPENFGDLLNEFKENELTDGEPQGLQIASFVVQYNPGNAPDHAGPPAHAGPPGEDNEKDNQGPPEHAKGPSDDESDEADEGEEVDAESEDDEDGEDDSKGNGNGKKNGHGKR
ncbi:hypothetical protein [Halosolutus gelatinilyticus]|uniref:hypothetical protein n=1 Tax=Halosolutus gelatinilyticus TaxID=2931975 RepID=UPI001FF0FAD9|nr:hypothetical protein [Halosolutus gelatinilyticus]